MSVVVAITRGVPVREKPDGTTPELLDASAEVRVRMAPAEPRLTREQLLDFVRESRATVVVTMFHDRVDAEFLDAAGPSLKGVVNFAVGIDNIDLALCRSRSVIVANTPDAVTEGTANIAVALMLSVSRRVVEGDRFVRSGGWAKGGASSALSWMGVHLSGQTMLIVGAGRIGRAVALRALGFGMKVRYVARTDHQDFERDPINATRVELDEGLALADVVSVHTPLTPETRHLLDARRLALLKPTAIVVNTSRGPTIDEAALVEALRARRIWGAGLDVLEREPELSPGLAELDNVVLTPHIGSAERYWREEMTRMVLLNARGIIEGSAVPNRVA